MTFCPAPNVQSRCRIGWASMPATDALEAISRRPVATIGCTAFRTTTAGIARINRNQRNTSQGGFVGQKGPQLGKRPTVVRSALRLSYRGPFADTFEIFDPYPATGVNRLSNDGLADPMVQIGGKTLNAVLP